MTSAAYDRGPVGPEHYRPDNGSTRRTVYIVIGVLLIALAVIGLFTHRTRAENERAVARAAQLQTAYEAAGLPVPSTERIVRTLGDDGGNACRHPENALAQAIARANLSNGATGPGQRPVIASSNIVEGQRLAIQVYCPEQLAEFDEFVNTHKYADVIKV